MEIGAGDTINGRHMPRRRTAMTPIGTRGGGTILQPNLLVKFALNPKALLTLPDTHAFMQVLRLGNNQSATPETTIQIKSYKSLVKKLL